MNINVSAMKGTYDAFDLADPRVGVQIDPIPVFMSIRFDRTLLRPAPARASFNTGGYWLPVFSADLGHMWTICFSRLIQPPSLTSTRKLPSFTT